MAKGPIITDEVRLLISEVHIAHPHWLAKDVQHEVNVRMRGKGPRISAIQKQLTTVRKASASVSKSLEAPWSIAVSADYGIPLETNEVLMKIWKWCAVVGMTLTIREAQWVARLRGVTTDDLLYSLAVSYARREHVCQLLGREEIYTADLDIVSVFPMTNVMWSPYDTEVRWAFLETWRVVIGISYSTDDLALFDKHAAELDSWNKSTFAYMNIPAGQTVEKYLSINPQHSQVLGENADIVYALWLRLFGSSPKWKNMTLETKIEMAMRLRKEVELEEKEIKDAVEAYEDSKTEDEKWSISFNTIMNFAQWKPAEELLRDVGNPQEHAHWKLVTFESEQSTRGHYWCR